MFFSVCLYVLVWVGQGTKQYKYHMSKHDSFKYWVVIFFWKGKYIYMDTILWQWQIQHQNYYFMAMASLGNLFNYTTKVEGGFFFRVSFQDKKFQGI